MLTLAIQPIGHCPFWLYWADRPCVPCPGHRRSCQGFFALTPRGINLGPRRSRSALEPHVKPMAQARLEHAQMLRERAASQASWSAAERPPRPRSAADVERRHAGSGGRIILAIPESEGEDRSPEDSDMVAVRRARPRSAAPTMVRTDPMMHRTRNEQPYGRRWMRKTKQQF